MFLKIDLMVLPSSNLSPGADRRMSRGRPGKPLKIVQFPAAPSKPLIGIPKKVLTQRLSEQTSGLYLSPLLTKKAHFQTIRIIVGYKNQR